MTRSIALSLAAIAIFGVAQANAQAARGAHLNEVYSKDSGLSVHSTNIDYADLNLATAQGREALYNRITSAAELVCRPEPIKSSDAAEVEDYNDCRATTIAQAMTLVRGPERAAMLALSKRRESDLAMLP